MSLPINAFKALSECFADHREVDKRRFTVLVGLLFDGLYDRVNVELEMSLQGKKPTTEEVTKELNNRRTPLAKKVFELFDSLPVDGENGHISSPSPSPSTSSNGQRLPDSNLNNNNNSPPTRPAPTNQASVTTTRAVTVAVNNTNGQAMVIRRSQSSSSVAAVSNVQHPRIKTEVVDEFTNARVDLPVNHRAQQPSVQTRNAQSLPRMPQQTVTTRMGNANRAPVRPLFANTRAAHQQLANNMRHQRPLQNNARLGQQQMRPNVSMQNTRQSAGFNQQLTVRSASQPPVRTYLRQQQPRLNTSPNQQQNRQQPNVRQNNLPMPVNIKQEVDDEMVPTRVVQNQQKSAQSLFPPVWSTNPPMPPKSQEEQRIIEAQVAYYKQNLMKGQPPRHNSVSNSNSLRVNTSPNGNAGTRIQPIVAIVPMSPASSQRNKATSSHTSPGQQNSSKSASPTKQQSTENYSENKNRNINDNNTLDQSARRSSRTVFKRAFEDFAVESDLEADSTIANSNRTPIKKGRYSVKRVKTISIKCRYSGCDKSFPDRKLMVRHADEAHGINPLVCPMPGCIKAFKTHGQYGPHIRDHGRGPWPCRYCHEQDRRRYATVTILNEHIQHEHMEGVYKCGFCDFTAPFQVAVSEHVETSHS